MSMTGVAPAPCSTARASGAPAPCQNQDTPCQNTLLAACNWPCSLIFKPPRTWQATCPRTHSHRNPDRPGTRCTRTMSYEAGSESSEHAVLQSLRYWLSSCRNFATRSEHMSFRPRMRTFPPMTFLQIQICQPITTATQSLFPKVGTQVLKLMMNLQPRPLAPCLEEDAVVRRRSLRLRQLPRKAVPGSCVVMWSRIY